MSIKIPFIASLGYRKDIDHFCTPLKERTGLDYFVVYILLSNGKKFVLSNIYHLLKPYYNENLYEKDYSVAGSIIDKKEFYLCHQVTSVAPEFGNMLEHRFGVFRTFYTIRHSTECTFVFGGALKGRRDELTHFYEKTQQDFDQFCFQFMHQARHIIKLHNPDYQRALFLNDENHLKTIIYNKTATKAKLSNREIECLIWAANGKTAEDTAMILNVSSDTVNHHRRSVINKLDCKNLCQAIYKALRHGYLGSFNVPKMNIAEKSLRKYNNVIVEMG